MELIQPGFGLFFWMFVSFALLLWILGKFAWKPIMKALKEREDSIDNALHAADKAREEMEKPKVNNEILLNEAKEERDAILRDARKVRDKIIDEAREKANVEANRIVENAKERIENEKMAAMTDLKNQIASLSIDIAEKILHRELSDELKQKQYIQRLIDEVNFN